MPSSELEMDSHAQVHLQDERKEGLDLQIHFLQPIK